MSNTIIAVPTGIKETVRGSTDWTLDLTVPLRWVDCYFMGWFYFQLVLVSSVGGLTGVVSTNSGVDIAVHDFIVSSLISIAFQVWGRPLCTRFAAFDFWIRGMTGLYRLP